MVTELPMGCQGMNIPLLCGDTTDGMEVAHYSHLKLRTLGT